MALTYISSAWESVKAGAVKAASHLGVLHRVVASGKYWAGRYFQDKLENLSGACLYRRVPAALGLTIFVAVRHVAHVSPLNPPFLTPGHGSLTLAYLFM